MEGNILQVQRRGMQKQRVPTEAWGLYSLHVSQTNGLGHELRAPGDGRMGSPGNEAKKKKERELQTEQKEEALGQLLCLLEDAGSCGNGAQSGRWLAKAGSAGTQQPSLPPEASAARKELNSAVSMVPGEGFHMLPGKAEDRLPQAEGETMLPYIAKS